MRKQSLSVTIAESTLWRSNPAIDKSSRGMAWRQEDMDFQSISKVQRVEVIRTDWEETINQRLDDGWILLHVYSEAIPSDSGPSQVGVYVLGWSDPDTG